MADASSHDEGSVDETNGGVIESASVPVRLGKGLFNYFNTFLGGSNVSGDVNEASPLNDRRDPRVQDNARDDGEARGDINGSDIIASEADDESLDDWFAGLGIHDDSVTISDTQRLPESGGRSAATASTANGNTREGRNNQSSGNTTLIPYDRDGDNSKSLAEQLEELVLDGNGSGTSPSIGSSSGELEDYLRAKLDEEQDNASGAGSEQDRASGAGSESGSGSGGSDDFETETVDVGVVRIDLLPGEAAVVLVRDGRCPLASFFQTFLADKNNNFSGTMLSAIANTEAFVVTEDMKSDETYTKNREGGKLVVGQIGFTCIRCHSGLCAKYPTKIDLIYNAVMNLHNRHKNCTKNRNNNARDASITPSTPASKKKRSTTKTSVKKQIWIQAFEQEKLVDDGHAKVVCIDPNFDPEAELDLLVDYMYDGTMTGTCNDHNDEVENEFSTSQLLGPATLEGYSDLYDE